MKTINREDVKDAGIPGRSREYLPVDWTGTALDLLNLSNPKITNTTRLQLMLMLNLTHRDLMARTTLRTFAIFCAVQLVPPNEDQLVKAAILAAHKYADDESPQNREELQVISSAFEYASTATNRAVYDLANGVAYKDIQNILTGILRRIPQDPFMNGRYEMQKHAGMRKAYAAKTDEERPATYRAGCAEADADQIAYLRQLLEIEAGKL